MCPTIQLQGYKSPSESFGYSSGRGRPGGQRRSSTPRQPTGRTPHPESGVRPIETHLKLASTEFARLVPRLTTYLGTASPTWPEVVDAADWLRHEMEIEDPLWAQACMTLGREAASVLVGLVSTKPSGHFRVSAGAYCRGMLKKARAGELNLAQSIWALRRAHGGTPSLTGNNAISRPRGAA